jgi:hypothetical protein
VEESSWLTNVFSDKLYAFFLTPLYMIIVSAFDMNKMTPVISRIGSRIKAMILILGMEYVFAVLYLCIWMVFILIAAMSSFSVHVMTLTFILDNFCRYLLGLMMVAIIMHIFRCSNRVWLSGMAGFCTVVLCAVDLLVIIPKVMRELPWQMGLLFSWIMVDGIGGYIGAGIVLILLHIYAFRISINRDII